MSWTHTDHTRALCRGTWLWPCSQSSDPSAQAHATVKPARFQQAQLDKSGRGALRSTCARGLAFGRRGGLWAVRARRSLALWLRGHTRVHNLVAVVGLLLHERVHKGPHKRGAPLWQAARAIAHQKLRVLQQAPWLTGQPADGTPHNHSACSDGALRGAPVAEFQPSVAGVCSV